MNVILVCESARITGGAERVAVLEALELRRRGIRVGFIAADLQADPRLAEAGVELCLLDAKSTFEQSGAQNRLKNLFSNPFIRDEVRAFYQKFDPTQTVVHVHSFRLKLSGSVIEEAQRLGFKTVIHCNEYGSICPTALYYNHREQRNCDLKPLSYDCIRCECQGESWKYKVPKIATAYANRSQMHLYDRTNLFIGVSPMSADVIRPHLPASAKIEVIPYPHDPPKSVPEKVGSNFAFIGRLVPEKAPEVFLEAARKAGVSAVVIGAGPMETKLRADFPEARFTGWVGDAEIEQEMQNIRCLVVPSRWRETYGLSVVDAMYRGIPCITTSTVGTSADVLAAQAGIVVAGVNSDSLADAFRKLSDAAFAEQCRANALKWSAENQRTPALFVDRILAAFEKLFQ